MATADMAQDRPEEQLEPDCKPATELSGITGHRDPPGARLAFLTPGGGWGGSEAPVLRAIEVARGFGLEVTSLKRAWGNGTSDHHIGQTGSFAVDLSNGHSPTPEMDALAAELARRIGPQVWEGGLLNIEDQGMRAQLIWRWPNHYNHVHFGVRRFAGGSGWSRFIRQPPVMVGEDVRTWQRRMSQRGWTITVDGAYGSASEGVCRRFQAERGVEVDGIVGPVTWRATFD